MKFLVKSILSILILSFATTPVMMQAVPLKEQFNAFKDRVIGQVKTALNKARTDRATADQNQAAPAQEAPQHVRSANEQERIELALYNQILTAAQASNATPKLASLWTGFTLEHKRQRVNNLTQKAKSTIFEYLAQQCLNSKIACPFRMPTESNYSQLDTFFLLAQCLKADNQEFCQALQACIGNKNILAIATTLNMPVVRNVLVELSPTLAAQFNFNPAIALLWQSGLKKNEQLDELAAQLNWRINTSANAETVATHQNDVRPVQQPVQHLEAKDSAIGVVFAFLVITGIIFTVKELFKKLKPKKAKRLPAHKKITTQK